MTATLFPAYGLPASSSPARGRSRRGRIRRRAPLAYALYLLEEPLAYPFSTTALWAITAAIARPARGSRSRRHSASWRRSCGASWRCYRRSCWLFVLLWRSAGFRRWRSAWSTGDWVGAGVLAVGVATRCRCRPQVRRVVRRHRLPEAARLRPRRLVARGDDARARQLPLVATIAAFCSGGFARRRGHAFVVVGVSASIAFVSYAAVKGAYLSTVFSLLVVERNVIYSSRSCSPRPRRFSPVRSRACGACPRLRRRGLPRRARSSGSTSTPTSRRRASRSGTSRTELHLGRGRCRAGARRDRDRLGRAPRARTLVRSRTVGPRIAVVAACGVTAWALTTEIYAARGLNTFSERMHQISPKPVDWVDRATGGEPTPFRQQLGKDTNPIWLLEFWNYSIDKIWSLDVDRAAPLALAQPGCAGRDDGSRSRRRLGRDRERRRGRRRPRRRASRRDAALARGVPGALPQRSDRHLSRRVDERACDVLAVRARERRVARLLEGRRLAAGCVRLHPTADVIVRIGPVAVVDKQPGFERVDTVERRKLEPCGLVQIVTRATVPYHVEVQVSPTFVPTRSTGW